MIEWLPWLPSKSCYTNLKFFETLKDTPNPSKGFRFVAFLVLEILGGGPFRPPPPPWCLVWVPKPLVPGGLIFHIHLSSYLKIPVLSNQCQCKTAFAACNICQNTPFRQIEIKPIVYSLPFNFYVRLHISFDTERNFLKWPLKFFSFEISFSSSILHNHTYHIIYSMLW